MAWYLISGRCAVWPAIAALMSNCASVFFTDTYCTIASWSYACFSKGRGRSESNTVIFHDFSLEPPPSPLSSRGILGRCWKQMVTGSNPARSLGNLYSSYPNPIKIPSCFQAQMNVSFRSPPPWASRKYLSCFCDQRKEPVRNYRQRQQRC